MPVGTEAAPPVDEEAFALEAAVVATVDVLSLVVPEVLVAADVVPLLYFPVAVELVVDPVPVPIGVVVGTAAAAAVKK